MKRFSVHRTAVIRTFFLAFLMSISCYVSGQTLDAEEQKMVDLINDYRAQAGLVRLKVSIALMKSADWLSADMATKNYFNHIDSLGRDPFARMQAFGYGYNGSKGENIAAGYSDAPTTFQQWKNSPTHNTIMLNPNFRVIGVSRVYNASSRYRYYWTTDFGQYIDATMDSGAAASVQTLNAANFRQSVAPDSLAAAFGTNIAYSTAGATGVPLPTSMAGVTVTVNGVAAPLIYVSPSQINYVIPASVSPGAASVNVAYNGALIAAGQAAVESVSPSIFTWGANGQGLPAALTTVDGVRYQSIANNDGSARPISVGTTSQPTYLVLYGTGLRRRTSLGNSRVTIGGVAAEIGYIGSHPTFTGLDQVNVKLPQSLRGRGVVDVSVVVDGKSANLVQIYIQ